MKCRPSWNPLDIVQIVPEPRGSLANLSAITTPLKTINLEPDEVLVGVQSVGINFRDVLNILGMYPGDPGSAGGDCCGTIVAVPKGSRHSTGDIVFGQAGGCLGTHVVAKSLMMAPCPPQISSSEAASLPTIFLTALACLSDAAAIGNGDCVLVHAATGGLGLAAIQVASVMGSRVIGTAGSPNKRVFLRKFSCSSSRIVGGEVVALDSRSVSFASEPVTLNSVSPTVIVNSLTSPGMVAASLGALSRGGKFIEVAKRDIWSAARVSQERPDVAFHTVAVDFMPPEIVGKGLWTIANMVSSGKIKTLPALSYGLGDVAAAMRQLSAARHIGKVVASRRQELKSASKTSWLITGGTGALGSASAEHLCSLGAKECVLLGRTGTLKYFSLSDSSTLITIAMADSWSFQRNQRYQVNEHTGFLHAGGVVMDAMLRRQNASMLRRVFAPKIGGLQKFAKHVKLVPMQSVNVFSSVASALGSGGQSSYAAANALMDAVAHQFQNEVIMIFVRTHM